MRGFDLVLRSEINRNTILPLLKLPVKFTDGAKEFAVGLLGGFDGVEILVHLAFNDSECAHQPEQIDFAFAAFERNVAYVVWRIFAG